MPGTAVLLWSDSFSPESDNSQSSDTMTYEVITDTMTDSPFLDIVGLPGYRTEHPWLPGGSFPMRYESASADKIATYTHDDGSVGLRWYVHIHYGTHQSGRLSIKIGDREPSFKTFNVTTRQVGVRVPGFRLENTLMIGYDPDNGSQLTEVWTPYNMEIAATETVAIWRRNWHKMDLEEIFKMIKQMNCYHLFEQTGDLPWMLTMISINMEEGETQVNGQTVGRWSVEYSFTTRDSISTIIPKPEDLNKYKFPAEGLAFDEFYVVRPSEDPLNPKDAPIFGKMKTFGLSGIGKDGQGWKTLPGI